MIVRISMEDQYELPDGDAERLNQLDNEMVEAVEAGDEERFKRVWAAILELVRTDGHHVADDDLRESDVILPPADLTFDEAAHEFTGEGLIPEAA